MLQVILVQTLENTAQWQRNNSISPHPTFMRGRYALLHSVSRTNLKKKSHQSQIWALTTIILPITENKSVCIQMFLSITERKLSWNIQIWIWVPYSQCVGWDLPQMILLYVGTYTRSQWNTLRVLCNVLKIGLGESRHFNEVLLAQASFYLFLHLFHGCILFWNMLVRKTVFKPPNLLL